MSEAPPLVYKIAAEAREFELIHRLNYRTFVEEIPQHAANEERRLVDRFHDQNSYVICMRGDELVGMIAFRGDRPFSLDLKLENLDSCLPPHRRPLEIRLLAIEPAYRMKDILLGLMLRGVEMARARDFDLALISGTTRQLALYRRLGFKPFGPLVGAPQAMFQPMSLTWDDFETQAGYLLKRKSRARRPANLLPGPVALSTAVQDAFSRPLVSHRSDIFDAMLQAAKAALLRLTKARHVALLNGSGTLANDVVGARLSLRRDAGLVVSNGEFGERLLDHAKRFRLDHASCEAPWGEGLDFEAIDRLLTARPQIRWLWAVHCETSTGVLNDLRRLKDVSKRHNLDLCLDCVSSIGAVETDLSGVHLASGAIGKAIGAPPGLSMVFTDREAPPDDGLPKYLDLGCYLSSGVPYTMPSNLVAALRAALAALSAERYDAIACAGSWLRDRVESIGFDVIAPRSASAPHVLTLRTPGFVDSSILARRLAARGVLVAHASPYLKTRNWIQLCLMGEFTAELLDYVVAVLSEEIESLAKS